MGVATLNPWNSQAGVITGSETKAPVNVGSLHLAQPPDHLSERLVGA
jgi:hypothetical protein